jgi:hypothetical protein
MPRVPAKTSSGLSVALLRVRGRLIESGVKGVIRADQLTAS